MECSNSTEWKVASGTDASQYITFEDSSGDIIPLPNASVTLYIMDSLSSDEYLYQNDGVVNEDYSMEVSVTHTMSSSLTTKQIKTTYYYKVLLTDSAGKVTLLSSGDLVISRGQPT